MLFHNLGLFVLDGALFEQAPSVVLSTFFIAPISIFYTISECCLSHEVRLHICQHLSWSIYFYFKVNKLTNFCIFEWFIFPAALSWVDARIDISQLMMKHSWTIRCDIIIEVNYILWILASVHLLLRQGLNAVFRSIYTHSRGFFQCFSNENF